MKCMYENYLNCFLILISGNLQRRGDLSAEKQEKSALFYWNQGNGIKEGWKYLTHYRMSCLLAMCFVTLFTSAV